jgi:lipoic acid synthetase
MRCEVRYRHPPPFFTFHLLHLGKLLTLSPPELRKINVDVVTFGQYMRPTKRHLKVEKYVPPAEFDMWRDRAMEMGFLYCASGPLVRSSYKAGEAFIENVLRKRASRASGAGAVDAGTLSRVVAMEGAGAEMAKEK